MRATRSETQGPRHSRCGIAYWGVQGGGGKAYRAISEDGIHFKRAAEIVREPNVRWLGALTAVNGAMRFYGTSDRGIWCTESVDGVMWSYVDGADTAISKVPGADPGVAFLPNGDAIVTATVMKPIIKPTR